MLRINSKLKPVFQKLEMLQGTSDSNTKKEPIQGRLGWFFYIFLKSYSDLITSFEITMTEDQNQNMIFNDYVSRFKNLL